MNRLRGTYTKRLGGMLPLALLVGALTVSPANAQDAQKCNDEIGKQVRTIAKTAAAGQDKCHGAANKVAVSGEICNDVTSAPYTILDSAKYLTTESKAQSKLHNTTNGKCIAGSTAVLDRLPGGDISNKYGQLDELESARATSILGEADLDGDAAKIKCFKTISSARKAITDKMLNTALACQKLENPADPLDRFNNADCLAAGVPFACCTGLNAGTCSNCLNDTSLNGLLKGKDLAIKAACSEVGISGDDVGSCDPLFTGNCSVTTATTCHKNADCPVSETCVTDGSAAKRGCVSQQAVAEGKILATIAFPAEDCTNKATPTADLRTATVTLNTPGDLGGVTVKVKYPSFDAGLAENGADINLGTWTYSAAFLDAFDLDNAVRISAADLSPITSGTLATFPMDVCRPMGPAGRACDLVPTQACTSDSQCTQAALNATCTARGIPHDCCSGVGVGCPPSAVCVNANGNCSIKTTQKCTDDAQCRAGTCANNVQCTGAGAPAGFNCCTGVGTGNCDGCAPLTCAGMPLNSDCTGAGTPNACCTGAGTGTCGTAPRYCALDTDCTATVKNAACTGLNTPYQCCTGVGTGTCTSGDCSPGEFCVLQGRSCSLSQHLACVQDSDCPSGETCASQRNLTTCEVEAATDPSGNPVDGVTCSVKIVEP